jgi:hypothetical protein
MTTAKEYAELSDSDKKKEDWMNAKWRPAMGWLYLVVCFFDFVAFPILWSVLQGLFHGTINSQWQPLTLQGAGLFHIAMGAIIGVAAWGRTQEKLNGANNGGIQLPANVGTTYQPPQPNNQPISNFNTPETTGFHTGFGASAPTTGFGNNFATTTNTTSNTPTVLTGFGGKPAPVQPNQPII